MQNLGQLPGQDYEFSELENKTIGKAATWAQALGILFFVQAGLEVFDFDISSIITILINIVIGIAFLKGGKAFKKVVDTEGNDLLHLMEALTQLGQAFLIRIIVIIIAVVFVGLGLLFFGAMAASM